MSIKSIDKVDICESGSDLQDIALTGSRHIARSRAEVLVVADVLAPGHGAAALVALLDGDVGHGAGGSSSVPVVLARLEEATIAGPNRFDGAVLALAVALALDHEDRLAERVGVPG